MQEAEHHDHDHEQHAHDHDHEHHAHGHDHEQHAHGHDHERHATAMLLGLPLVGRQPAPLGLRSARPL